MATSCECQEPAANKDPQSVKSGHKKCGVFGRIVGHLQQEQPQRNRPTKGIWITLIQVDHARGARLHGSCFFGMANSAVNEPNPCPSQKGSSVLLAKESPSTLPVNLLASKLCSSTIFLCELKNFRTVAGSMWLCAEATHLLPYCQGVVKVFDSRQLCSKSHAHSSFGRRKHITCSSLDVVRAIGTRQVAGRYNLNTMKVQVFRRLFGTKKSGSSSIPPVNSEIHRYL